MTQNDALKILMSGVNVFLTGEPGSGKTYTINQFVATSRARGKRVAITASTGIAATHIGGVTIHSWSGLGIKRQITNSQIDALFGKPWVYDRISEAQILIIDEVSMLAAYFIDNLDLVLRRLKGEDAPFGGMQIVFVGDFFQLPPVVRDQTPEDPVLFAFQSAAWESADLKICYLTEQHRQDDGVFLSILKNMREGVIPEEQKDILRAKAKEAVPENTTRIYTHNIQVDVLNDEYLDKIPGREQVYTMKTYGIWALVDMLRGGCLSPERLRLKVGATVMFTRNNFDKETGAAIWVNGTIGTVVDFRDGFPVIETKDGERHSPKWSQWAIEEHKIIDGEEVIETKARIEQIPLRLAWAITVHKSQGMSLDAAVVDLSKTFEFGQGYVAISRVRSLNGLFLMGLNSKSFAMHPTVVAFDKEMRRLST